MSLFCISKHEYMHKGLLSRRYGRSYDLPLRLPKAGIDIALTLINYRWRDGERVGANDHPTIQRHDIPGAGSIHLHTSS